MLRSTLSSSACVGSCTFGFARRAEADRSKVIRLAERVATSRDIWRLRPSLPQPGMAVPKWLRRAGYRSPGVLMTTCCSPRIFSTIRPISPAGVSCDHYRGVAWVNRPDRAEQGIPSDHSNKTATYAQNAPSRRAPVPTTDLGRKACSIVMVWMMKRPVPTPKATLSMIPNI